MLECHVSPGVGRNFRVTINSGGQSSLTHRSNLSNISYFTPLLKSVTGAGTREASTAGGQIVNVEGDYLGPIVSTASLVIVEYGKYPDSWNFSSPFFPPYREPCVPCLLLILN